MTLSVLVLYAHVAKIDPFCDPFLKELSKSSSAIHFCNARLSLPSYVAQTPYQGIILHPSLLDLRFCESQWAKMRKGLEKPLANMQGVKIALALNPAASTSFLTEFLLAVGVTTLFAPLSPSDLQAIYPQIPTRHSFPFCLEAPLLPLKPKRFDLALIGKEREEGPPSLKLTRRREEIGEARALLAAPIHYRRHDPYGFLHHTTRVYLEQHPQATLSDAESYSLADEHPSLNSTFLSPDMHTALALKTCLILPKGDYGLGLVEGKHYLEEGCVAQLHEPQLCEEIAARAYQDYVSTGRLSYTHFAKRLLHEIAQKAALAPISRWQQTTTQLALKTRHLLDPRGKGILRDSGEWRRIKKSLSALFPEKPLLLPKTSMRYPVAIAAIFQNEAAYLAEWINYHQARGVSHFYLYNNRSTDNYREALQPYQESGLVELIEWPAPDYPACQLRCYREAILRARGEAEWLALIDIDEFFVPHRHESLPEFLLDYADYAGIAVNWQVFGTSKVQQLAPGRRLTEQLTWKFPAHFHSYWQSNWWVKSIVQPLLVSADCRSAHSFKALAGKQIVDPEYRVREDYMNRNPHVPIERIQLNHYYFRTQDWWETHKLARLRGCGLHYDEIKQRWLLKMSHAEQDFTIQRFYATPSDSNS